MVSSAPSRASHSVGDVLAVLRDGPASIGGLYVGDRFVKDLPSTARAIPPVLALVDVPPEPSAPTPLPASCAAQREPNEIPEFLRRYPEKTKVADS